MFFDRKRGVYAGLVLGALAMGAGCSSLSVAPAAPRTYDLGPDLVAPAPAGRALAAVRVEAPLWLDATTLQFRLMYQHPLERLHYRDSRWVAPPPRMLTQMLTRRFAPQGRGCQLVVSLDEFVQRFDTPAASRFQLLARAALLPPRSTEVLAQTRIELDVDEAGSDAAAGVAAAVRAAAGLGEALAQWLAGQRLAEQAACGA